MVSAPVVHASHGSAETILGGLHFDNPVTFQGDRPVMGESKKIECARDPRARSRPAPWKTEDENERVSSWSDGLSGHTCRNASG